MALRTIEHLYGRPTNELSQSDTMALQQGNYFALKSARTAETCLRTGIGFGIENPEPHPGAPSLFLLNEFLELQANISVKIVNFDQCTLGAETSKPTRILYSGIELSHISHRCTHPSQEWVYKDWGGKTKVKWGAHPPLFGRRRESGEPATKAASAYPYALNKAIVRAIIWATPAVAPSTRPQQSRLTPTVNRDPFLKGLPDLSKKQRREVDNNTALGGMRNPHGSVRRIQNATQAGHLLSTLLRECVTLQPRLLQPVHDVLTGGSSPGFLPSDIVTLKSYICNQMQNMAGPCPDTVLQGPGLDPCVFRMWTNASGDPDTDLAGWLHTGAPLGIIHPVTSKGIFPAVDTVAPTIDAIASLASSPAGWENYRSSEEDPNTTSELLKTMVDKGWAQAHSSWESLTEALSSQEVTLNKLALLSKVKPDGSTKHRLVWDLLRSDVNAVVQQGERVVLPRIMDFVNDAWELSQYSPGDTTLHLFGTDISDAFHQVPLHPSEWRLQQRPSKAIIMSSKC